MAIIRSAAELYWPGLSSLAASTWPGSVSLLELSRALSSLPAWLSSSPSSSVLWLSLSGVSWDNRGLFVALKPRPPPTVGSGSSGSLLSDSRRLLPDISPA